MVLVLFACKNKSEVITNKQEAGHENKHWSYIGETSPEHWAEIIKNTACSGFNQSPINIIDSMTVINTGDARKIDILKSREQRYKEKIIQLKIDIDKQSVWGDFNIDDLNYIKNKGIDIRLYEVKNEDVAKFPDSILMFTLNKTKLSVAK